jgi:hypothetical protein
MSAYLLGVALYMVAVDFPSGDQRCNNIITNNSKLIKLIKLINLLKSDVLIISTGTFQFESGDDAETRVCTQHK